MDQATFLEKFGAVFEHSPWVAEAVFRDGGGVLTDAETLAHISNQCFWHPILASTSDLEGTPATGLCPGRSG